MWTFHPNAIIDFFQDRRNPRQGVNQKYCICMEWRDSSCKIVGTRRGLENFSQGMAYICGRSPTKTFLLDAWFWLLIVRYTLCMNTQETLLSIGSLNMFSECWLWCQCFCGVWERQFLLRMVKINVFWKDIFQNVFLLYRNADYCNCEKWEEKTKRKSSKSWLVFPWNSVVMP